MGIWAGAHRPLAGHGQDDCAPTAGPLPRQGTQRLILVAREVFSDIRYARNLLLHTLCILSATAGEDRRRFGFTDPPWDLIGIYTQGRLLSPPRSG